MIKYVKRYIAGVLYALLMLSACPAFVLADGSTICDKSVDVSWYKSDGSEFYISTPQQLAGVAAIVNGTADEIEQNSFFEKTLILTQDLDLNGREWTPIGTATVNESMLYFLGKPFAGTLTETSIPFPG